jgi:hypothetical protein
MGVHDLQHGEPGPGHPQIGNAQLFCVVRHW